MVSPESAWRGSRRACSRLDCGHPGARRQPQEWIGSTIPKHGPRSTFARAMNPQASTNRSDPVASARSKAVPPTADVLGPEAYRALYDHSPDGVLFTVPDGRVLAANNAACQILGRTEAEICSVGRQGMADHTDE